MTDERWQVAYAIYEAAAPLAEPERSQYVHAAAPDEEIAGKVLAMLAETETIADSDAFPKSANSTYPAAAPQKRRREVPVTSSIAIATMGLE